MTNVKTALCQTLTHSWCVFVTERRSRTRIRLTGSLCVYCTVRCTYTFPCLCEAWHKILTTHKQHTFVAEPYCRRFSNLWKHQFFHVFRFMRPHVCGQHHHSNIYSTIQCNRHNNLFSFHKASGNQMLFFFHSVFVFPFYSTLSLSKFLILCVDLQWMLIVSF